MLTAAPKFAVMLTAASKFAVMTQQLPNLQ